MRSFAIWIPLPLCMLLLCTSAICVAQTPAPDAGIHVGGAVSKPTDWTAVKLRQTFAGQLKKVEYTIKGQKHASTCVPLLAIVQAAEPVTDPKHKNFAMRLAVVVQAGDGYAVTFGMGDLMPDVGNREAWLALDMDRQALAGRDAPAKLIVPSDAKPSRAIWGISKIDVIDPTAGPVKP